MSKFWSLTKVLLKTDLFASSGDSNKKKKSNKYVTWGLIGLLIVFVIGSLGVPIVIGLNSILKSVPISNIIISLILPLAGVTTIVFSIFSVVSVFYLSKNSEYLLPMPLKARDIMLSKFIVSLITDYYILFLFILPALIGVGVGINANFLYYLYTLIIFILLPIIPSAIVTLVILFLTRFTGIFKNKDLFMYISMGLVLVFTFGYNYIVQNVINVDPSQMGNTFADLENNLIPYFKWIFPFYNSASSALINFNSINGLFSIIAFLCFNVIAVLIIYFFGDKLYLKTLISTNGSKKKKENIENVIDKKKNYSAFSMLMKKEWLVVKRTPVFMLNIVFAALIVPIIVIGSGLMGVITGSNGDTSILTSLSFDSYLNSPIAYFIVLLVCVFFTSSSLAASTAISREGSNAWFMKVIPVSYLKQINVKVIFASIIDIVGILLIGVIVSIMIKIPALYVISVFIPLLIIDLLLNYFNILLDLKKPKLKWSEESAAVKQNFNGFLSMVITAAVSGLLGICAYVSYKINLKLNIQILSLIISSIFGIVLFAVILWFKKNENKLLENVD